MYNCLKIEECKIKNIVTVNYERKSRKLSRQRTTECPFPNVSFLPTSLSFKQRFLLHKRIKKQTSNVLHNYQSPKSLRSITEFLTFGNHEERIQWCFIDTKLTETTFIKIELDKKSIGNITWWHSDVTHTFLVKTLTHLAIF